MIVAYPWDLVIVAFALGWTWRAWIAARSR